MEASLKSKVGCKACNAFSSKNLVTQQEKSPSAAAVVGELEGLLQRL